MATVKQGKSGRFNGKIGDVVLSMWDGILTARDVPTPSKNPKTVSQLDQQSKFKLVTVFMTRLSSVLAIGFQGAKQGITATNAAVRLALSDAVTGVYPNYALDYPKIVISQPTSTNEINDGLGASAVAVVGSQVTVSWSLFVDEADPRVTSNDLAYLAFYNSNLQRFTLYKGKGSRKDLTVTAQLSRAYVGHKFYGYMFFVSPNGKLVSRSEYLGTFTLLT